MARIEVRVETPREAEDLVFVAKGSGIGWFQDHILAIAQKLRGFTPPAMWLEEGLVLLPWIEGSPLAERPAACDESFVRHAARYVAERSRGLPAGGDWALAGC